MKIFLLLLILAVVQSQRFYYSRVLSCIKQDTKKCAQWNESTILSYITFYSVYCLSENNYVLSRDGAKSMKELTIGDELWGYDLETGKQTYSKLVAWLHRNTKGIIKYDSIHTKQGLKFEASDYHNIGFVDEQGKIDFKFAKDLNEGDELVGFPEHDPYVKLVKTQIEKRGLYTPFTESGNFYIFDSSYDGSTAVSSSQPMILVHALAHVNHPSSQLWKAEAFIKVWSTLGLNKQPDDDELYMHPLYSDFSFIFGSSWEQTVQQVKYPVNEHMQALPSSYSPPSSYSSKPSYSSYSPSSSYSSYPSSSSYSSYPSSSSYSSYPSSYNSGSSFYSSSSISCSGSTSTYNCEQERQDKMKAMGLSISIIEQIPLL